MFIFKVSFPSFCRLMCHMWLFHSSEYDFEYKREGAFEYLLNIFKPKKYCSRFSKHEGEVSNNLENEESTLRHQTFHGESNSDSDPQKRFFFIRKQSEFILAVSLQTILPSKLDPGLRRTIVLNILKRYAKPKSYWQAEYEEYATNAGTSAAESGERDSVRKMVKRRSRTKYGLQFYHASDTTPLAEEDMAFDSDAEKNVDTRWLIEKNTQAIEEDEDLTYG